MTGDVVVSQVTADVYVRDGAAPIRVTIFAVVVVIVVCRVASRKNRKRLNKVRTTVCCRLTHLLSRGVVAVDGVREHVVRV